MTDNSKAPERIWAYPSYVTGWGSAIAHDRPIQNSHEYIRADLHTTALAEKDAEIARLTQDRDQWAVDCEEFRRDAAKAESERDAALALVRAILENRDE